jgi:hypothetical protein
MKNRVGINTRKRKEKDKEKEKTEIEMKTCCPVLIEKEDEALCDQICSFDAHCDEIQNLERVFLFLLGRESEQQLPSSLEESHDFWLPPISSSSSG